MTRVEVYGRELPQSFIDAWEIGRSRAVAAMLRKEFDIAIPAIPEHDSAADLPALRRELTDAKLTLDPVQVRNRLATPVRASGLSAKALSFVSARKLKASEIEIVAEGTTAESMVEEIQELFLTNSPDNHQLAMAGSPDHYVMQAHPGDRQEILETTGGAPIPSQFFIQWGDDTVVGTPRDMSYPLQMSGTARLANGTIIGAVRHQYRNEGDGFRVRLADEFPAVFPKSMIAAHQLHLACEFVIWYEAILLRQTTRKQKP